MAQRSAIDSITSGLKWQIIPLEWKPVSRLAQDQDGVARRKIPLAGRNRVSIASPLRAIKQASWTIVDQGLLGVANFTAALVLARWLTPVEYGGYTAASAVFWMTMTPHHGLLSEPIMVFGASRFRGQLPSYFAVLSAFHCCLSGIAATVLIAVGLCLVFWGSIVFGSSLLGYALAAPVVLLLPMLRVMFYVRSTPQRAAGASCVYMVGMLGTLYLLQQSATLTAFTAPLAAAGATALAVIGVIASQRAKLRLLRYDDHFLRGVARAHWQYGRWAVLTQALDGFPSFFYYLIVPLLVGLEANAALRVLIILIMPAIQANTAFAFSLVPAISRSRQRGGDSSFVWKVLILLVVGAGFYALFMAEFSGPLINMFYRGHYTEYAHLGWLAGLIPIPFAATIALGSTLRAHERPDLVLSANLISAAVTCVFGSAAVALLGLPGAILGLLGGYVTTMLVMLWWVLRTCHWPEPRAAVNPVSS